jgi:release factor glutamine methyltransferase
LEKAKVVINKCIEHVSAIYSEHEASSVVWSMVEHFFGLTRITLALDPQFEFNYLQIRQLHKACRKLLQHTPVQYITGKTIFEGLSLEVNKFTLIPRPETEELTQFVIQQLPKTPCRILDIGTGTGCIALAIKKQSSECEVYACDISRQALQTAKKNAKNNRLTIHFFECDILNPETWKNIPEVDVIVSNPPYVLASEKNLMAENILQYEPEQAIFVPDETPLIFYEAIVQMAKTKLIHEGSIFFEVNEIFADDTAKLLKNNWYKNILIQSDFREKKRFVFGKHDKT